MSHFESWHSLTRLLSPFGEYLFHVIVGAAALMAVGVMAYGLLARRSPQARHTVLAASAFGVLVMPLFRLLASGVGPVGFPGPRPPTLSWTPGPAGSGLELGGIQSVWIGLGAVWAIGATLLSVRLALAWFAAGRLTQDATPLCEGSFFQAIRDATRQAGCGMPEVVHSRATHSPFVFGLLRPSLVIPTQMLEADQSWVRAIAVHEVAHIARQDGLWTMAAVIARAIYWPIPLIWWIARRVQLEAERACDRAVVRGGVPRSTYIKQLIQVTDSVGLEHSPAWVTSTLGSTELFARVHSVAVDPVEEQTGQTRRRLIWGAVAALALLLAWFEPPTAGNTFVFQRENGGESRGIIEVPQNRLP